MRSRTGLSLLAAFVLVVFTVTLPPKSFHVSDSEAVRAANNVNRNEELLIPGAPMNEGIDEETKRRIEKSKRQIDLSIFVVFHKELKSSLYQQIDWSKVTNLGSPDSPVGTSQPGSPLEEAESRRLMHRIVQDRSSDHTLITFLATNEHMTKSFDRELVAGRLLYEWELPGYDRRLGAMMNEFGAMNSLYMSNLTVDGPSNEPRVVAKGAIAADADGDGVQEWIGILHSDMKIDRKILDTLRRRITQQTVVNHHMLVGTLRTTKGVSVSKAVRVPNVMSCCLFYAVSYPTPFLLQNDLGEWLIKEYNSMYGTKHSLADLPGISILDGFIVPTKVFNHMMPFIRHVMVLIATEGIETFKHIDKDSSVHPTVDEVLERTLAVALGLESTRFMPVQLPIRHEKTDRL